ncbi:LytTR family DNA-binding domain-containing protein [Maribacter litopenaei]|uniref:LytTR family DNA-binding domain-containing protein n=1 Tax=Maribacter litopenaei TaxID=2976127 RepID=A0ABY5Y8V1_9FLAO|nr:LytTR family DNA-binding domain-containing protein [Maribacter litopenaei]UWX54885.1 LytTR family DNA-binding domain-containing protein [Maribacter litopenaei]
MTVTQVYRSSKEGLLGLRENDTDLLFPDVEMPWMNGIELLTALGDIPFHVIFTTAHDKYAVQAFRLSAIDYLLKPIDKNSLVEAVQRVLHSKNPEINQGMKHLVQNMDQSMANHRIAIPTREGLDYVLIEDILYCEADSNYTRIYLNNGIKLLMSKPLKELTIQLRPYNFIRIHHSYFINLNHMLKYVRGNAGYVVMVDGKDLSVSRFKNRNLWNGWVWVLKTQTKEQFQIISTSSLFPRLLKEVQS